MVTGLAVGTALGAYALAGDPPGVVLDAQSAGSVRSLRVDDAKPWEQEVLSLLERPVARLADLPPAPAFEQLSRALAAVEAEVDQHRVESRQRRRAEALAIREAAAVRQHQRDEAARAQAEDLARMEAAALAVAARVAAEQQAAAAAAAATAAAEAARVAAEQQAAEAARQQAEAAAAEQEAARQQAEPLAVEPESAPSYEAAPSLAPAPEAVEPPAAPAPAPAPVLAFAPASISLSAAEARVLDQLNEVRASVGLGPLGVEAGLVASAQAQVANIAAAGSLFHQDLHPLLGAWGTAGENVGYGPNVEIIHGALVASPGHYANMVNGAFTHVGVAVTTSADGRVWVAQVFAG